jgi:transposase
LIAHGLAPLPGFKPFQASGLTALWMVVTTMNFSLCSCAEQAAAYAGLAPMPRESGTSVHKRPCIGHTGNGRLRTVLYMATLSAARYNPVIKGF